MARFGWGRRLLDFIGFNGYVRTGITRAILLREKCHRGGGLSRVTGVCDGVKSLVWLDKRCFVTCHTFFRKSPRQRRGEGEGGTLPFIIYIFKFSVTL